EDIAMLFGDDDFSHDDSEGVEEEEVWEEVHPHLLLRDNLPPPSTWTSYTSISDRGFEYLLGRPEVWTRTTCKEGDTGIAGSADYDLEGRGDCWINSACAGFTGSYAAERYPDLAAADYGFGDEQL
nr:hypothetical protein [Tanacetum cinerariifolium]